jgi:hypothetical protein
MFFTPGTEDYFHRFGTDAKDAAATGASETEAAEQGKKKLDEFVNAKLGLDSMDVDAPAAAAVSTTVAA